MTAARKEARGEKPNSPEVRSDTRQRIGVIFYGEQGLDFFREVYEGIELAAASYRQAPEILVTYSASKAADQVQAIDEMVKKGIRGLIISPVDDLIVADTIRRITAEGVVVVTVHTDISDCGRLAYVGTDPYKTGTVAAEAMCLLCEEGSEIGIVTGSRNLRVHEERVRGFMDHIKRSDRHLSVESIASCRDEDYKAYELVQKMMSDSPGISAFFFATTGGIYGGCKGIFTMTTRLKFHVVTLGVYSATREFMKKGLIDASIYQSPKDQGMDACHILSRKLYMGEDPASELSLQELSVKTRECLYL